MFVVLLDVAAAPWPVSFQRIQASTEMQSKSVNKSLSNVFLINYI